MSPRILALLTLLVSSALSHGLALLFNGEWRLWHLIALCLAITLQWAPTLRRTERSVLGAEMLWLTYVTVTSSLLSGMVYASILTSTASSSSAALASFLILALSAGVGMLGVGVPHTPVTLVYVVFQVAAIKLLGAASFNLLSEEAYYWKYAESLSYGYLDHPPLVALLIWLGERLVGTHELGVRLGALLSWSLLVVGATIFAKEATGKSLFIPILFLCSILPFTTSMGFFMTPDSPLVVAWMFGLVFLQRVLFLGRAHAWWGVGVCIGLGLLSKYPMVLFGAAIPVFLLLDPPSRKWLIHPLPFSAAGVALIIFSPVILWNYQHRWASFAFQSSRRFAADSEFSLHLWGLFLLLSATPLGVLVLAKALFAFKTSLFSSQREARLSSEESPHVSPPGVDSPNNRNTRLLLFSLLWCVLPLGFFGYASFTQEVKINWLGPAFLSLLPFFAISMYSREEGAVSNRDLCSLIPLQRGWFTTGMAMSLFLHVGIAYVAIGVPYLSVPKALKKLQGWSDLASVVRTRESEITQSENAPPVIVGGDSHYVASELGFYRARHAWSSHLPLPPRTQGRELFGAPSLMFKYWSVPDEHLGKTCIVVSRSEGDVADGKLTPFFSELLPPEKIQILREGKPFSTFFLRVGRGYRRGLPQ